jgi:hypothetical protein
MRRIERAPAWRKESDQGIEGMPRGTLSFKYEVYELSEVV